MGAPFDRFERHSSGLRRAALACAVAGMGLAAPAAGAFEADPGFGKDGSVTTSFGRGEAGANAVAVSPGGKLVAAGDDFKYSEFPGEPSRSKFALARYRRDGKLDTSFGSDGTVETGFGDSFARAEAIVVQPDGRVVAAGGSDGRFTLARYLPDGSLDDSFGTRGKVQTAFERGRAGIAALVLQPDGKLVAAGVSGRGSEQCDQGGGDEPETCSEFALARYGSDGSLDEGFGDRGRVLTGFAPTGSGPSFSSAGAVVLQPDGKLVAAGEGGGSSGGGNGLALARYRPDGTPDERFGSNGKLLALVGDHYVVSPSLVRQADGNLVAGSVIREVSGESDNALLRLRPNGSLDRGFGSNGVERFGFDRFDERDFELRALALDDGRRLIAAGDGRDDDDEGFALTAFKRDGSVRHRFKDGPEVTSFRSATGSPAAMVSQPNGKLVVSGTARSYSRSKGYSSDFALARYRDPSE